MIRLKELDPKHADLEGFNLELDNDAGFENAETKDKFYEYYYEDFKPKYGDNIHDLFELMYTDQELFNKFVSIMHSKDNQAFEDLTESLELKCPPIDDFLVYMGILQQSMNVSMSSDVMRLENIFFEYLKEGKTEICDKIINVDEEFITELIHSHAGFDARYDSFEQIYNSYRETQQNIITVLKLCGVHFSFISRWNKR